MIRVLPLHTILDISSFDVAFVGLCFQCLLLAFAAIFIVASPSPAFLMLDGFLVFLVPMDFHGRLPIHLRLLILLIEMKSFKLHP